MRRSNTKHIIALGVASADEVNIETLQHRLDQARIQSAGMYINDVMFDAGANTSHQQAL